tara:strand:- start:921 stop:1187 length:267 start_codon:yes stop_codon:yes gene_type:complete
VNPEIYNFVTFKGKAKRGPTSEEGLFNDVKKYLDGINDIELSKIEYAKNGRAYVYYTYGDSRWMSKGKWEDLGDTRELYIDFETEKQL